MPRPKQNDKNKKPQNKPKAQSAKGKSVSKSSQKKQQKQHFLMVFPKPEMPRAFRMSIARKAFLKAYEETFGNVSASCEFAGINRATFYRWIKSKSRINLKFQEKLSSIQPQERELDYTHAKLMERIKSGDTQAIIYNLKTKGRARGYVERKEIVQIDDELSQLRKRIAARAAERGVSFHDELALYLEIFPDIKPEIRQELVSELVQ